VDVSKVEAILTWPKPKSVMELVSKIYDIILCPYLPSFRFV